MPRRRQRSAPSSAPRDYAISVDASSQADKPDLVFTVGQAADFRAPWRLQTGSKRSVNAVPGGRDAEDGSGGNPDHREQSPRGQNYINH
jgi:hypothetical protein